MFEIDPEPKPRTGSQIERENDNNLLHLEKMLSTHTSYMKDDELMSCGDLDENPGLVALERHSHSEARSSMLNSEKRYTKSYFGSTKRIRAERKRNKKIEIKNIPTAKTIQR